MTLAVFAIPGDLATRTGGYAYARELIDHLPDCGIAVRHCALPGSFPQPSDADVIETFRALRATAKDDVLLIDGLAFGALPADRIATLDRAIVALVHHPLGFETGLSEAAKQALIASERAALGCADHVIVSSDTTRDVLVGDFGVAAAAITIAEPGTRPVASRPLPPCGVEAGRGVAPLSQTVFVGRPDPPHLPCPTRGEGAAATVRLLAVGSIVPRKGFDILVEALAGMRDLDWRLRLVGSLDRSAATAQALRIQLAASELTERVDFVGELGAEPLGREYSAADLFVLSSHYEGYGMVLTEAMAHGLPIVTTTGGAAARTVPDAAALKIPPGDAAALSGALRRATSDAALRQKLAAASRRAANSLPRWPATAATVAAVLHEVARRARP
jgi:glycosyltransferase involved in cell wall biosynthesis